MKREDLDQLVDRQATVEGIAYDAHAGAVIVLDDRTPVYVDGLSEWEQDRARKPIRASGTLRRRRLGPEPETGPQGEVSHGIEGESYVLEGATWSGEPS